MCVFISNSLLFFNNRTNEPRSTRHISIYLVSTITRKKNTFSLNCERNDAAAAFVYYLIANEIVFSNSNLL